MKNQNKIKLFVDFIKHRLNKPLPGIEAQKIMAPFAGKEYFRTFEPSETAHKSAVLVLLSLQNNTLQLVFTLRSNNISHSGQISFPGGKYEDFETAEMTALRETREEIGISTDNIILLGRLTGLFVPPSDTIIIPVVGYTENIYGIDSNNDEVEEVFFVPFDKFIGEKNKKNEVWDFKGIDVEVPFWDIHPTTPLWGATAMILIELITLYDEFTEEH
ncbi:NUDIX hydrolase [Bacteroidota bacterium]